MNIDLKDLSNMCSNHLNLLSGDSIASIEILRGIQCSHRVVLTPSLVYNITMH